jgi:hypothetical protein
MNSLTAVLAWDYLRRHYRVLGYYFAISTFFVVALHLTQGFFGIEQSTEYLGFRKSLQYNMSVPVLAWLIMIGMMVTQQQITQLYLKPISSFAMVSFFYWWGALLVAGQVAVIVCLVNLLFSADWPIAQSVLFSMLYWGLTHSWGVANPNTIAYLVVFFISLIASFYWYMALHGVVTFGHNIVGTYFRLAALPSAANVSVTAAAIALGFCLSVWRVSRDRSGQTSLFTGVRRDSSTDNKVNPVSETKPRSWAFLQEPLRRILSPREAYQRFDFRYRTRTIPAYVAFVFVSLLLFLAVVRISMGEIGGWRTDAFYATCVAACAQPMAACYILTLKLSNRSPMMASHSALTRSSLVKLQDSQERFFFNLPISDREIAAATLRSSLIAVGISFLVVTVPIICFWGLGLFHQESIKIPYLPEYSLPDVAPYRSARISSLIREYLADYSSPVTALALALVSAALAVFLVNARVVVPVIQFKRYLLIPAGLIFVLLLASRQSLTTSLAAASLSWLLMVVVAIYFVSIRFVYRSRLSEAANPFGWTLAFISQMPTFALAAISLSSSFNLISMHDTLLLTIAFNLAFVSVTITVIAAPLGVRRMRTT